MNSNQNGTSPLAVEREPRPLGLAVDRPAVEIDASRKGSAEVLILFNVEGLKATNE